jgi:hypothetical protein
MTAARIAFALALACAVLIGGARAGGAFAQGSRSHPPSTLAYPLRAGEIAVGDDLEVSGQPMQLSLFYTSDPPQRVARFYADAFRDRGLLPVVSGEGMPAHVSAFEPAARVQRFISAIPQPDGQTLVLMGATDPRRPPRFLRPTEESSLPRPPEHRAFLGFRSADAGSRAESAQFVSALPPREIATFYREALAADGYSERQDTSGEGLLTFARPGATVSVALQKLDEKQGAAVFVTRVEGGVH